MREIKFRFWDGRKMIDWDFIKHVYECAFLNNAKIMQYTGLEDKNGKEIYEGDIVENLYVVEWCEQRAKFSCKFEGEWDDQAFCNIGTREVIGNIYENPELIIKETK